MEIKIHSLDKFVCLYENGKFVTNYEYTKIKTKENGDVVIYGDNDGDEVVLRIVRQPTIL